MLEFIDAVEVPLAVFIAGAFVLFAVWVATRNMGSGIGKAINRLAAAVENSNRTKAEDLEAEREAIRDDIRRAVLAVTEKLGGKVDGVAEEVNGEIGRLDEDVKTAFDNTGKVAAAAERIAERVGVAGSDLWRVTGGLEGRVDTTQVRMATGTTGTQPAVVDRPAPLPPAPAQAPPPQAPPTQHQPTAQQPRIPGATPPGTEDAGGLPYDPDAISERTQALLAGRAAPEGGPQVAVPPFDPDDRRAVWDYMLAQIQALKPGAYPWDIHPGTNTPGGPHTYYDVFRVRWGLRYGVQLPQDMHELWRNLVNHDLWLTQGPYTEAWRQRNEPQ